MCTHMVLECVDSYMHWSATKLQLYRVSSATLQTLHARVVWGVVNQKNKEFFTCTTGGTMGFNRVRETERGRKMVLYNNKYVAVASSPIQGNYVTPYMVDLS